MLDVHPPHHPTHTWRDFFIHIATICVGLLIAIGLEQTVEAMHHHHQRRELEAELREEARKNLILIDIDERGLPGHIAWLSAQLKDIHAMQASHKIQSLPARLKPDSTPLWWPDPPVWEVSKASGQLALLPQDEAAMFNLVYAEQGLMHNSVDAYNKDLRTLLDFERRFSSDPLAAPQPDTGRMSAADLSEYEALTITTLGSAKRYLDITQASDVVTTAAYNGARTDEELFRKIGGRSGDGHTSIQ